MKETIINWVHNILAGIGGAVVFIVICYVCFAEKPHPELQPWTVVKQRGHQNYGYITESKSVAAGFTNKHQAIIACDEARWYSKNPTKPYPVQSMWEPQ